VVAVEAIAVEVAAMEATGKWLLQKSNNKPAAINAGRMDHSFAGQWWQHEQLLLLHRSSRL